jgi:hypothetical protein
MKETQVDVKDVTQGSAVREPAQAVYGFVQIPSRATKYGSPG